MPDLALVNGSLIDGTGAAPVANATLVIRDGLIQAVGPDLPATGARIIDVQGRTVLPGFCNAHVHRAFKADVLRA